MDDTAKKAAGRFALRLPPDVDAEVRELAQGKGQRPPYGINETIVFLLRRALKQVKEEGEPGNITPAGVLV